MPSRTDRKIQTDLAVGCIIRERRLAAGLSMAALAERSGCSWQAIQKYERGRSRARVSTLYEIAEALGAPVADFLPDANTPAPNGRCRATLELQRAFARLSRDEQTAVLSLVRSMRPEAEPGVER